MSLILVRITLLFGILLSLTTSLVHAESTLPVFQSAEQEGQSRQRERDYVLPLGSIRRELDGYVGPRPSQRVDGEVVATTYRIRGSYPPDEVFRFFEQYVVDEGYEILFQCDSFQCGRSSFWANDYFGVSNLFGPDSNQFLLTALKTTQQTSQFVVIYVIERANRRVYYHTLEVEARSTDASNEELQVTALEQSITNDGRWPIAGIRYSGAGEIIQVERENVFAQLVQVITAFPSAQFVLVGHDRSRRTAVNDLLARSETMAEAERQRLPKAVAEKLKAYGVGPLAPARNIEHERWVELVRLD